MGKGGRRARPVGPGNHTRLWARLAGANVRLLWEGSGEQLAVRRWAQSLGTVLPDSGVGVGSSQVGQGGAAVWSLEDDQETRAEKQEAKYNETKSSSIKNNTALNRNAR